MPEQVLTILKVCLIALLYLFFLRVLRAVWADVGVLGRAGAGAGPAVAGGTVDPSAVTAVVPVTGGAAVEPAGPGTGIARALKCLAPPAWAGREVALQDGLVVGRGTGCDVRVDDPMVSGRHARITLTELGWAVTDLDSRNGTFVNDDENPILQPTLLRPADRVRCGHLILEVI